MLTPDDLRAAADRVRPHVHRTPVLTCAALDRMAGASLFFKCENFQKVGAFKIRGATNAVLSLPDDQAARGVATHSSGNHAAALASAARLRGVPAHVVMPETAAGVKRRAVEGYGANVITCGPTLDAREKAACEVCGRTGATFVPPYNHEAVIAGQATAALELLEDVPDLDVVIAPVGGGGLLAGTALAVRHAAPSARTLGAEPAAADDARRSFKAGRLIPVEDPRTVADGLRTSLGDKTFPIIREAVDDIITVSEEEIVAAMRLIWERMKLVVEPSAAVPLAAVLRGGVGGRVGVILTGGNVDLDRPLW